MIRPQQQQDQKRQEMIDALKKNDKVITTAGIYGTVVSVDADHDRVVLGSTTTRGQAHVQPASIGAEVVETSQEKAAESA